MSSEAANDPAAAAPSAAPVPEAEPLRPSKLTFPIVGIGGSAGALSALLRLFERLPADTGMGFVVVVHLSPDHESHMPEILQRATPMPVKQVGARVPIEANHVYVIAPGADLLTDDGHVQPAAASRRRPSTAIDVFFRALGDVHRDRAICVVLSGAGADGSIGLGHVKEGGGIAIAQAPQDAEFVEMPRAAIATGLVDLVLAAADIGARLAILGEQGRRIRLRAERDQRSAETLPAAAAATPAGEQPMQEILALLRTHSRHDFKHYKRSTVLRRLMRRMQINGLDDLTAYRDHLALHPKEAVPLLQDMLISVTRFFRDPDAFAALDSEVLLRLFDDLPAAGEVRIWIAGCATGEECYSVGMLAQEHAQRLPSTPRVQIFGTDINEDALAVARRGIYPTAIAADVSAPRLARFFQREGDRLRVSGSVRDQLLFAKHNLLGDPPFSRLDLICCRNVLIYLDSVAQNAVLETFGYALKPGGFLFLGNSESADALGSRLFMPVDKSHRIFRLRSDVVRAARVPIHFAGTRAAAGEGDFTAAPEDAPQPAVLQHQIARAGVAAPSVLIDGDYEVLHMSAGAGEFVGRGEGVPSHNLFASVSAEIGLELRAALLKASESGTVTHTRVVQQHADGSRRAMTIAVHPVEGTPPAQPRWLLVFEPWRDAARDEGGSAGGGADEVGRVHELEAANRELKLQLQQLLDKFVRSNEEAKAASEEQQAINEELRSATEELETSKEELESMNEELSTVNFELRAKVEESARTNDDLRNLMAASDIATVFVDAGLRIRRFTPQATGLFHLIPGDVGRPLLDIRSRLRYEELAEDAAKVFSELRVLERRVESDDGRQFLLRVLPYRSADDRIEGAVLTFFDVTELYVVRERVRAAEARLLSAISLSEDFALITTDPSGTILTWNSGAQGIFGHAAPEIIGRPIELLFVPEDRAAGVPEAERGTALEKGRAEDERWHLRQDGGTVFCSGVMTPLRTGDGIGFAKIARDVTVGKHAEQSRERELRDQKQMSHEAKVASDLKDKFLAVMSHELKQPLNLIQVNAELLTRLPEAQPLRSVLRIGETIQHAVAAQTKIVDDLLDLSRIQTGKLGLSYETIDLVELARMLGHAIAEDLAKKGVAFEIGGARSIRCACDRVRVEQILWNLLGNAAKFTPAGGRIALDLREEADFARMTVSDSGVGIAPESLPRVFDMFSQAGAAGAAGHGGLGIGLALVSELARAHGGRVEAQSEGPNRGATFTVWLPLSKPAAGPRWTRMPDKSLRAKRLLVVDDHADSLELFATLLRIEGAEVDTAPGAKAALELLSTKRYDLLVSDLSMPDMDGFDLIARVREIALQRDLRAIAVTGYGREVDVRNALDAGFDAHVCKPVSLASLYAALKNLKGWGGEG